MLIEGGEEIVKEGGIMTFQTALIAAVVALFGVCVALGKYISMLHHSYAKKIEELMNKRIEDLQSHSSMTSTLEDVTYRERGTRRRGE